MTTKAIEAGARALEPYFILEDEHQLAQAVIEAAIASGELVLASAVAAERERCADLADKKAADLLVTSERLRVASQATKLAYTEVDLHEQSGTAIQNIAAAIRALEPASGDYVLGWRPIHSAPKDHFPVLVWCEEYGRCVAFRDVNWNWWPCPAHEPLSADPIYWQSLPERPAQLNAATSNGSGK